MENVEEIQTWGPCIETESGLKPDPTRAGETFKGFVAMLTDGIDKTHPAFAEACEFLKIAPESEQAKKLAAGLGYSVDWKTLKACDYGAPTIRKRFYLIARRDGQPIIFPKPTHGKGLKPYKTAADCIDWTIPCLSIFGRKKPLAVNTLRRIARGTDKWILKNPSPYIMEMNYQNTPQDPDKPMTTQTTANHHYLITPSIIQYHSEQTEREVRGQEVAKPLNTVDAAPRYGVNACFLSKYFSGEKQAGASAEEPVPTVTAIDHNALVAANLIHYYGGADHASKADDPLATVTVEPRHYITESHLCILRKNTDCKPMTEPTPTITAHADFAQIVTRIEKLDASSQDFMRWAEIRELLNKYAGYSLKDDEIIILEINNIPYFLADIGMRMLKAEELKLAQGFPSDYVIDIEQHIGKKYSEAKQIARLGNAVCPPVATALVRANCAEICTKKPLKTVAELEKAIATA